MFGVLRVGLHNLFYFVFSRHYNITRLTRGLNRSEFKKKKLIQLDPVKNSGQPTTRSTRDKI